MSLSDKEKNKNVVLIEEPSSVDSFVEAGFEKIIPKSIKPRLIPTMRASLSVPKGILEADPKFKDRYTSMELPYADSQNILAIWRSATSLKPNEFIRLTGRQISSFRMSSFTLTDTAAQTQAENMRKHAAAGTMRTQNGDLIDPSTIDIPVLGSFQHAIQSLGGWRDLVRPTAIDVYDGLVKELGIEGAPSYKQLLENGFLELDKGDFFDKTAGNEIPDISYRSHDFTASQLHPGIQVYFSMDGYFPDSEIDNDISYVFGVCVHTVEANHHDSLPKDRQLQIGGIAINR